MYRTRLLLGLVGFAILFVLPGIGFAKDYCVNAGGSIFLGQKFTIPPKGSCKSWVGFTFVFAGNSPSSGAGCTSSDGKTFNLTITTAEGSAGGAVFIDSMTLSLPAQTGTDNETVVSSGNINSFSATGAPCKRGPIPAVVAGAPADAEAGIAH